MKVKQTCCSWSFFRNRSRFFPFTKELSRQKPDLPDCFYPWLISLPQWTPGPAGSLSAGTACPLQTAWSCCSILPWLSDKLPELPSSAALSHSLVVDNNCGAAGMWSAVHDEPWHYIDQSEALIVTTDQSEASIVTISQ